MKAKRLRVIVLVLACLVLLIAIARFLSPNEPTYQGKTVGAWFKEYAFASNASPPVVLGFRTNGANLIMLSTAGARTIPFTNRAEQLLWMRMMMSLGNAEPDPDPALVALRALGSNAVPHLVRQLQISPLDRTYERAFTNLPVVLQRKLPSPALKRFYRSRALQLLSRLGDSARGASPALVEVLKQPDPALRREVIHTLSAIHGFHANRREITTMLLKLGAQKRYTELTEIALETGWDGGEVTRLLGELLRSPDPALRRNAIRLLERVGRDAAPALEQITTALGDSDSEVRYLAARSLEYIGTNTPTVTDALRASLEDDSVMVRTVARRTLKRIAPEAIPPAPVGAAGQESNSRQ